MKIFIPLLLTIIASVSVAVAQSKTDKIEIGIQSTSLTIVHPDFAGDETLNGVGGRVTYNFNRSIAAEAEVNFFPQKPLFLNSDGKTIQAQFGVKVGKRFDKFGFFAKVRPGFLSVSRVFSLVPGPPLVGGISPLFDFKVERTNFFTLDTGGVLELYPSKRFVVRLEAGDTAIRHPNRFDVVFGVTPAVELTRPEKFTHNFQFTAGVGFRLGDFPEDNNVQTSGDGQEQTPRFEVGAQFTSLFVRPPNAVAARSATAVLTHTEPGVGGRFTFNLTESVALEAEGNYYTRELFSSFNDGGHMFQGQFGAKVGKRFDKWGLFGKARPGFVGFTKVFEVLNTSSFRFVRKLYPSVDIGGVVELYIARRWLARFDIGDTIIRYGEIRIPGAVLFVIPRETQHNLQVSSGIGFRF